MHFLPTILSWLDEQWNIVELPIPLFFRVFLILNITELKILHLLKLESRLFFSNFY